MKLRDYQAEAVDAAFEYMRGDGRNPCIVIPTGGGKTPVMAEMCRRVMAFDGCRVLILAHRKELLLQIESSLHAMAPNLDVGVFSAGLNRREGAANVVIGGIQTVWNKPGLLGRFDLIIIDEAHMLPVDAENTGQYRKLLAAERAIEPNVRVVGLTATPYRMREGTIAGDTADHLFDGICYEVDVLQLMESGYLSQLISRSGHLEADLSGVHTRGGEFVPSELEAAMDQHVLVEGAVREMVEQTADGRHSVLVFCVGREHGKHVHAELQQHDQRCEYLDGETPPAERARILDGFKAGEFRWLVNIDVLTTGFDAPNVDCVVLLRPTQSPGLYYQMVGRGFRLHETKSDCLILDFGGNIDRHGAVNLIKPRQRKSSGEGEAPQRRCPKCGEYSHTSVQVCPCGFEFPPPERQMHGTRADDQPVVAPEPEPEIEWLELEVMDVRYFVHHKKDASETAPKTMKVSYRVGMHQYISEWVCFEHDGFALRKAVTWWQTRSHDPVPLTAAEAVMKADAGALAIPHSITVLQDGKFPEIVSVDLGEKPDACEVFPEPFDESEVPF